jgi:DNA-directed RNA polymerase specialized sigma24 family protein
VSTRFEPRTRTRSAIWPGPTSQGSDPAEEVAIVSKGKREILLRAYCQWLRREDLEDCFSQATLELVARARRGGRFSGAGHIANALEQKFLSRIHDRRRALRGRSPSQAMLDGALSLGTGDEQEFQIADPRADVERCTMLRFDLRSVERAAHALSPDQRLVLACQIGLQMSAEEFCTRFGWTHEKHRKVAQRARARLRALLDESIAPMGKQPAGDRSAAGEAVREREALRDTRREVTGARGEAAQRTQKRFSEHACPVLADVSGEMAGTHL